MYCRVSWAKQRADLAWQVSAMEQFCLARGLSVNEWVKEVGGGMDLTRPRLLAVMDAVETGQVGTLVVAHRDRLARFGFEYRQHVAAKNGCEILVAHQESLSPRDEMVQDLLGIVDTFSCRLDGLARYEKTLREDLGGAA